MPFLSIECRQVVNDSRLSKTHTVLVNTPKPSIIFHLNVKIIGTHNWTWTLSCTNEFIPNFIEYTYAHTYMQLNLILLLRHSLRFDAPFLLNSFWSCPPHFSFPFAAMESRMFFLFYFHSFSSHQNCLLKLFGQFAVNWRTWPKFYLRKFYKHESTCTKNEIK